MGSFAYYLTDGKEIRLYRPLHSRDKYRAGYQGLGGETIAENMASRAVGLVLMILIIVVIAAALFGTVNDSVTDMTNTTHDDYVGATSAGLVSLIPILYWILVIVVIVGAVMGVLKYAG